MPKLIPKTFFFGTPSVIHAQRKFPKQFLKDVSVLWTMVVLSVFRWSVTCWQAKARYCVAKGLYRHATEHVFQS